MGLPANRRTRYGGPEAPGQTSGRRTARKGARSGRRVRPVEPDVWLNPEAIRIVRDIADRIEALRIFDVVVIPRHDQDPGVSPDRRPLCRVSALAEADDDAWPDMEVRTLTVSILITAAGEDQAERLADLSRLADATRNALNRQSLADATIAGRTRTRSARYLPATPPDQSVLIELDCPYFIDSQD